MIKHLNAILWALTLFVCGAIFTMNAMADDVQWSQGYTAGCLNPTQRTDGTTLTASEIAKVEYYLDQTDGNITTPELTVLMSGGCKDMYVNTKVLSTGTYYAYARAFDTDGLVSDVSVSVVKTIMKAKPKPPAGLR